VLLLRVIEAIGAQSVKCNSAPERVKWEQEFNKITSTSLNVCLRDKELLEKRLYEGLSPLITQLFTPPDQHHNPDMFYNPNAWISSPKISIPNTTEPPPVIEHDPLPRFIHLRQHSDQTIITPAVPVTVFNIKEYLEHLTFHIMTEDGYDKIDNGLEKCYWFDMWRSLTMLNLSKEGLDIGFREGCVEEVEGYIDWFVEEVGFEVKKQFLGLIVEYFELFARYKKAGFLETMSLSEALEFYIDQFPEDELRRRDEGMMRSVGLGQEQNTHVLVGHLGFVVDALDR